MDCHTHVLGFGDQQVVMEFMKGALTCVYRTQGKLPVHSLPTEKDWESLGLTGEPVDPIQLLEDHAIFDKIVILAWSPRQWPNGLQGTIDLKGATDVPGPPTPEKCNDYIASLVNKYPEKFIGFASVNPMFKGPEAAINELERAIDELKLTGLKLYPTYQHWSPADSEVAFPIFQKAEELDIPVMLHMAGSSAIDAPMKYSKPMLLDDVGRKFRKLRVIIGHMGIPWEKEALFMLQKHPNFYAELSYFNGTIDRETLYRFLLSCKPFFVPLGKLFFGTDYPIYDPNKLVNMLRTVNDEAKKLKKAEIPEEEIDGILGDNFAKVVGIK